MTYWRNIGITYLQFSKIAARQIRQSLKIDRRPDPIRETSTVKLNKLKPTDGV